MPLTWFQGSASSRKGMGKGKGIDKREKRKKGRRKK